MGGRKKYLVSYDISNDKERNKIAKLLEEYGGRVQYSVFECSLTMEKYKELYQKLINLICFGEDTEANVRIYPLCKMCEEQITVLGINNNGKSSKIDYLQEDIIIV